MGSKIKLPTPITIIGGFLGAGKTSLLSHILRGNAEKKLAVLVNDFGQLNIDAELIVNIEGETVSLTNGCICCTIRNDLMTEVLRLLSQESPPEHIIIETSGVSDPTLVAHTFQLTAMNGLVEVDSIIAVVDADQALKLAAEFQELAKRQIKIADLVIVNKIDLVSKPQVDEVIKYAVNLAPKSRIVQTIGCQAPLELIMGNATFDKAQFPEELTSHKLEFQTWTYTSPESFTFIAIRKIMEALPTTIYRAKGFIQLEDAPQEQGLFQMTGGRSWLRLGHPWQSPIRSTRLVFIGKADGLKPESIKELIDTTRVMYNREALHKSEEPVIIEDIRALTVIFD